MSKEVRLEKMGEFASHGTGLEKATIHFFWEFE